MELGGCSLESVCGLLLGPGGRRLLLTERQPAQRSMPPGPSCSSTGCCSGRPAACAIRSLRSSRGAADRRRASFAVRLHELDRRLGDTGEVHSWVAVDNSLPSAASGGHQRLGCRNRVARRGRRPMLSSRGDGPLRSAALRLIGRVGGLRCRLWARPRAGIAALGTAIASDPARSRAISVALGGSGHAHALGGWRSTVRPLRGTRFAASGLLIGFAGLSGWRSLNGPWDAQRLSGVLHAERSLMWACDTSGIRRRRVSAGVAIRKETARIRHVVVSRARLCLSELLAAHRASRAQAQAPRSSRRART